MQQDSPSIQKLAQQADAAKEKGRLQEALQLYQQVLTLNPHHAGALFHLGHILHSSGDYASADLLYNRAIQEDPQHFQSYALLCEVYESQNLMEQAIKTAEMAAKQMPHIPQAYCLVASKLMAYNIHLVPAYLENILPQFPENIELRQFYCFALKANNRFEEADAIYQQIIATKRVPASFRIIYETMLPRLNISNEQIDAMRTAFANSVAHFIEEKPRIQIETLSNHPLFALAYHNRDNKEMLKSYTQMLRLIAPELNYVAPHCKAPQVQQDRPIRIGFISKHMHDHPVGKCYRNSMIELSKQADFSVTFFNLQNINDSKIKEIADAGIPIISVPKHISSAQETIANHKLDILIYPDIGMDATTHYMAMARLAPYQVCLGGHPETTGIDTVDYVLAARTYEPENAQENYTERLLCIDGVSTIFRRPTKPERWLTRRDLGLPEDHKLYMCPMAIQKFHPDFDAILAGILERDPQGILVLFSDFQEANTTVALKNRILQRCDPSRVIFLPWLNLEAFQSILKLVDAVLDTIYFGGGTTSQYAFDLGVPIVTMPGRYARGRVVNSYYEIMEIEQKPVAKTREEYVSLAYKLANDKEYYASLNAQILERSERLFEIKPHLSVLVQLMRDIYHQKLDSYRR